MGFGLLPLFNIPETQLFTNEQRAHFLTHLAKSHEDYQVHQVGQGAPAIRIFSFQNKEERKWICN